MFNKLSCLLNLLLYHIFGESIGAAFLGEPPKAAPMDILITTPPPPRFGRTRARVDVAPPSMDMDEPQDVDMEPDENMEDVTDERPTTRVATAVKSLTPSVVHKATTTSLIPAKAKAKAKPPPSTAVNLTAAERALLEAAPEVPAEAKAKATSAAESVVLITSSVCLALIKPASKAEGAR